VSELYELDYAPAAPALAGDQRDNDLTDPALFINRELSWLAFNDRVLEEALDPSNPLLERAKFLAITSSNLDEFFMVRVSGLLEQARAGIEPQPADGMTASQQITTIRDWATRMNRSQREVWSNEIRPGLRAAGIAIDPYSALNRDEQRLLTEYFKRQVYPVLTPLAVDVGRPFPHISNLSLNMLIVIEDETGERVARLKLPPVVPRFIEVPGEPSPSHPSGQRTYRFVLLEEVIEANLDILFPGKRIKSAYMFRLTRDSDIEIREPAGESLLTLIEAQLEQRLFGFVVRLTIEPAMPPEWRSWLAERLVVPMDDIYVMERPLGFSDLMQLYRIDRPDLKDTPNTPQVPRAFRDSSQSVFDVLKRADVIMYHPYDSFTPVVDFVRQASSDPNVMAIKQTLYRVGSQSPIVEALLEARDDEKQVAVLVELKARFDEESNINWARALESAGVHVAYGISGLKTHSKVTLVVRREGHQLRRYVHLGTGNYNPTTARIYTDISFMTVDEDIAADVSDVFNLLTGYSEQKTYRKLLVAPINLRAKLTELIQREAEHGQGGRIILKMNSLSDPAIIRELYRASRAGVQVDIIARGICCLRPGVANVSETIRVISIVGPFLEHPRVYYFAHGSANGGEAVYAGSADLMPRNLDHRVEILFPVEDPVLLAYLRDDILLFQLTDNVRARELQPDGSFVRLKPSAGEERVDAQASPGRRGPEGTPRSIPVVLS
jgi:polyphosphate kinase